ncbi:DUF547 domain-containing protein [Halorubrum tebenquichense]|uniref:DUF547 domain-containing protein n=1 Tax=Halorubrum tebenquichense DSM 14210 TaxID=1227485 RepID=M0DEG4_9EURY|nr:DUF547 domain-containing protein [Halorubrum tebenquichense]ELZ33198.1 hypothetical protein C472_14837 [Halorubrum tebenquichense DSM 14210]
MTASESTPAPGPPSEIDSAPVETSQRFLRAVRAGSEHDPAREDARTRLAYLSESDLDALGPDERLAFWLNAYNAATGDALLSEPDRFESRRRFFSELIVTVAGEDLSLDAIEHGILRGSQWKYGLGYVPNPLASSFVRRHRVAEPDFRIHFALNCGAASCPAVAAYDAEMIDADLDAATENYLRSETVVEEGTAYVPRLLLWYRGDFGGGSGIRRVLREYDVVDPDAVSRVRYREYDWSLALDAFRDGGEGQ